VAVGSPHRTDLALLREAAALFTKMADVMEGIRDKNAA